ncbi:CsgG/HfaB family protein [uncultured Tateyamaria sp.]|uniref:CsgG/HfaB family protein n=1 Tax=uncultured Tateyamaria sp. TaxID=455651 RepID=UPI00261171AE|nr:CsgG/HfaB family protein [uncultured Tateyamaria sp.]
MIASVIATLAVAACADGNSFSEATSRSYDYSLAQPSEEMARTKTGLQLETLTAPHRALDVAVYAFPDLTGKNETSEGYAEFSRAVTQGGADILADVLMSAGHGKWFNVIERGRVDNLLRERAIIEQTQKAYSGNVNLPPLRFAGTLIEGSIVGYDSNLFTGGAGVRFLGIGFLQQYRKDVVTVSLRAVSVSSGRVLTSVTTTKTIYSVQTQNDVFRFTSVDELLEIETGVTRNEPEIFAVRDAMELAVLSLIIEGAESGQWAFASEAAGQEIIASYKGRYKAARTQGLP